MTATLSTRLEVQELGPGEIELTCDYDYSRRHRELMVHNCFTRILGTEIDVWHKLTQQQRAVIEEQCVEDYVDRMDAAREQRYEELRAYE